LEVFATQTSLALESASAAAIARDSEVRVKTEEMRSSLLSAVSHDLRTPLASITGAATSLLGQGDRFTTETRNELLESIADEAERLGRLVNNLLEMTRLDSGTVEIHRDWHSLEEMVGATMHRMTKALSKHDVKISLPSSLPLVQVDDVLVVQVVVNLLENAAKYTPEGTEIEIAASTQGTEVAVDVRDRGPGFDDREVNHLFEKFYRGKPSAARGVGLGLAIAHAIVRAQGGRIEAANRAGGGAVIRFTLPAPAMLEPMPDENVNV
jgi:two-component system sensor histidine kinase KdpD